MVDMTLTLLGEPESNSSSHSDTSFLVAQLTPKELGSLQNLEQFTEQDEEVNQSFVGTQGTNVIVPTGGLLKNSSSALGKVFGPILQGAAGGLLSFAVDEFIFTDGAQPDHAEYVQRKALIQALSSDRLEDSTPAQKLRNTLKEILNSSDESFELKQYLNEHDQVVLGLESSSTFIPLMQGYTVLDAPKGVPLAQVISDSEGADLQVSETVVTQETGQDQNGSTGRVSEAYISDQERLDALNEKIKAETRTFFATLQQERDVEAAGNHQAVENLINSAVGQTREHLGEAITVAGIEVPELQKEQIGEGIYYTVPSASAVLSKAGAELEQEVVQFNTIQRGLESDIRQIYGTFSVEGLDIPLIFTGTLEEFSEYQNTTGVEVDWLADRDVISELSQRSLAENTKPRTSDILTDVSPRLGALSVQAFSAETGHKLQQIKDLVGDVVENPDHHTLSFQQQGQLTASVLAILDAPYGDSATQEERISREYTTLQDMGVFEDVSERSRQADTDKQTGIIVIDGEEYQTSFTPQSGSLGFPLEFDEEFPFTDKNYEDFFLEEKPSSFEEFEPVSPGDGVAPLQTPGDKPDLQDDSPGDGTQEESAFPGDTNEQFENSPGDDPLVNAPGELDPEKLLQLEASAQNPYLTPGTSLYDSEPSLEDLTKREHSILEQIKAKGNTAPLRQALYNVIEAQVTLHGDSLENPEAKNQQLSNLSDSLTEYHSEIGKDKNSYRDFLKSLPAGEPHPNVAKIYGAAGQPQHWEIASDGRTIAITPDKLIPENQERLANLTSKYGAEMTHDMINSFLFEGYPGLQEANPNLDLHDHYEIIGIVNNFAKPGPHDLQHATTATGAVGTQKGYGVTAAEENLGTVAVVNPSLSRVKYYPIDVDKNGTISQDSLDRLKTLESDAYDRRDISAQSAYIDLLGAHLSNRVPELEQSSTAEAQYALLNKIMHEDNLIAHLSVEETLQFQELLMQDIKGGEFIVNDGEYGTMLITNKSEALRFAAEKSGEWAGETDRETFRERYIAGAALQAYFVSEGVPWAVGSSGLFYPYTELPNDPDFVQKFNQFREQIEQSLQ